MRSLQEVYERLEDQPFVAEFKYDGQRAQIHAAFENERILEFKIFSRHLEDMTTKVYFLQKRERVAKLARSVSRHTTSHTIYYEPGTFSDFFHNGRRNCCHRPPHRRNQIFSRANEPSEERRTDERYPSLRLFVRVRPDVPQREGELVDIVHFLKSLKS